MTCIRFCLRSLTGLLLIAGFALAPSCGGGGGGGGGVVGTLVALFTASQPSPAANTVSMQPGTATNDVFQIKIMVTDVSDFFGATFRVTFPTDSVAYLSSNADASFLHFAQPPAPDPDFVFPPPVVRSGAPGTSELWVTVTRKQNSQGTMTGVTFSDTRELLSLTFSVKKEIASPGADLTFGNPAERKVCSSVQDPANNNECVPITGVEWKGGTVTATRQ